MNNFDWWWLQTMRAADLAVRNGTAQSWKTWGKADTMPGRKLSPSAAELQHLADQPGTLWFYPKREVRA